MRLAIVNEHQNEAVGAASIMGSATAPVYAFVHIPKTGGQSLQDHLASHLEKGREFVHLGKKRHVEAFARRSQAERAKVKVVVGHQVGRQVSKLIPDREIRYVAFLRDPAARIVSTYNFRMNLDYTRVGREPISFELWYGNRNRNQMVTWLYNRFTNRLLGNLSWRIYDDRLKLATKVLRSFHFVGLVERFEDDAREIMDQIGLPGFQSRRNVSGKDFPRVRTLDDDLRRRLYADNPLDVELYRIFAARARSDSRVAPAFSV